MTEHYVAAPVACFPEPRESARVLVPAHPSWCDFESCAVGGKGSGTHNSKPIDLRAARPGSLGIAVTLTQGTPIPGCPLSDILLVDLTFTDTDDDYHFGTMPMDIDLAHSLGHVLAGAPTTIATPLTAKPNASTGHKPRWMNRSI